MVFHVGVRIVLQNTNFFDVAKQKIKRLEKLKVRKKNVILINIVIKLCFKILLKKTLPCVQAQVVVVTPGQVVTRFTLL